MKPRHLVLQRRRGARESPPESCRAAPARAVREGSVGWVKRQRPVVQRQRIILRQQCSCSAHPPAARAAAHVRTPARRRGKAPRLRRRVTSRKPAPASPGKQPARREYARHSRPLRLRQGRGWKQTSLPFCAAPNSQRETNFKKKSKRVFYSPMAARLRYCFCKFEPRLLASPHAASAVGWRAWRGLGARSASAHSLPRAGPASAHSLPRAGPACCGTATRPPTPRAWTLLAARQRPWRCCWWAAA